MRVVIAALFVVHGALHLPGFAKAFGFASLPQLTQPISRAASLLRASLSMPGRRA